MRTIPSFEALGMAESLQDSLTEYRMPLQQKDQSKPFCSMSEMCC